MKRLITLMLISFAVSLRSQSGQELPAVDQVLDNYVRALGGRAALEKLTSRASKGTFEFPAMGVSAPVEIYEKAPNKSLRILDIPGYGKIREGFDGAVGWSEDPQSGLREKSGAELAEAKRDAEFYLPLKFKEIYKKLSLIGRQKVGDREAYLIEAAPAEGNPERLYFDIQTGLLMRQDSERETPQGKLLMETYLEDYREVEGVKEPFLIRVNSPAFSFTIRLQEVKHNVEIEDSRFSKPQGQ
jgi:hypothetical protein